MAKKREKSANSVERRERIILAAIEAFRTHGPLRVRFSEIAQIAKIDPPLIHYYFKSLEDLQYEVILRILANLREGAVEAPADSTPVERMTHYVSSYFQWAKAKPDLFKVWIYFYTLAIDDPRCRELNTTIRKQGRDRIRFMIYEGVESQAYRPALAMRADQLALHIQGLITGNVIMAGSEEGLLDWQTYEDETVGLVLKLLGVTTTASSG